MLSNDPSKEPMKNDGGTYSVTLFDDRGRKVKKTQMGMSGLIKAQMYGESAIEMGEGHSFVVERVLFNSLEKRGDWT